jgi:GWxTD domain-containing protein
MKLAIEALNRENYWKRCATGFGLGSLMVLFAAVSAFGQKHIQAVVTHNTFYSPTGDDLNALEPYLEVYWQMNPNTLPFVNEEGVWRSRIQTDLVVRTDTGIVYEEHYVLETSPFEDANQALAQNIMDMKRFRIPSGKMYIELKLSDVVVKSHVFIYADSVQADASRPGVFYSDIQLVDTFIQSAEPGIFQRNGQIQIPMSSNFLNEQTKEVRYYAELYNAHTVLKDELPLVQHIYVSKKTQEDVVFGLRKTDTIVSDNVNVISGSFSTASLPSGNYYLNVSLANKFEQKLAYSSVFFQLVNPHPIQRTVAKDSAGNEKLTVLNLAKTFVSGYKYEQVKAILRMLAPIATPNEAITINNFLKRPDETYMRYFVYNFWLQRNSLKPEQAWKDYTEKVKEVNKIFGNSSGTGYESERGMLYLKYGKPDERIIVSNESGSVPYEIWQYNVINNQGNGLFLFYSSGYMSSDYKLLHSTVAGEIRNPAWRSSLFKMPGSQQAQDSKAEQYFGQKR